MSTYDVRRSASLMQGGAEPLQTRSLNRKGKLATRSASASPLPFSPGPSSPSCVTRTSSNGRVPSKKHSLATQRSISVSPLRPGSVSPMRSNSLVYNTLGALVDPALRSESVSPLRVNNTHNPTTSGGDYARHTLNVSPYQRPGSVSPLRAHSSSSSAINKSLSDLTQQRSMSVSPLRPDSVTSHVLSTAGELTPEERSRALSFLLSDAKQLHQKLLAISLDAKLDPVTLPKPQPPPEELRQILLNQNKPQAPEPRPSVGNLVDELSEVEARVGGEPRQPPVESGTKRANITASTATLELDELMANLSNFEPPPGVSATIDEPSEPPKPKSAADDLDLMLGSLDHDMAKRHGINTTAKGICAACNKPILAKVVDALGKQWHPEHFTCVSCDTELGQVTYYESNGRPYCEKDYHELYAPRCAYCNGPILERVMRALDKTWHPEHFFCTLCGKHFGPEGFHEKDSKAFCRECYYEKFAPRCRRCDKAIMEGFITALGAQWHPECFSCKVCQVTFPRGNYFDHEGEPHCEIHYHASRGTLCASCQKPVTGKCITAMGKKWHPEHFTCAFCLKLLNKGTFKEHRHNPYCQPCYIKLFG